MATTTNYGWTTPNDTDLVKDGAAAIRTLGSAIDTTVFNNSSTGIAKTIVDAKGDLIAATAADTVDRLAVGANDTVLTADSSTATGLKWAAPAAGGMTLLSTTTLSGATTTISSINQGYVNLFIQVYGVTNATADGKLELGPNGDFGTGDASFMFGTDQSTSVQSNSYSPINLTTATWNQTRTDANNVRTITFNNYASTTYKKSYTMYGMFNASQTSFPQAVHHAGAYNSTSLAITSLVFRNTGGNLSTGTVLVYGVK
jgi:hypothetical protein